MEHIHVVTSLSVFMCQLISVFRYINQKLIICCFSFFVNFTRRLPWMGLVSHSFFALFLLCSYRLLDTPHYDCFSQIELTIYISCNNVLVEQHVLAMIQIKIYLSRVQHDMTIKSRQRLKVQFLMHQFYCSFYQKTITDRRNSLEYYLQALSQTIKIPIHHIVRGLA